MMLFKLSLKNIQKSVKDYAIYFFTLILGVAIFYIFNSIESQTIMMNISKNTLDIIELMNNMLSGVSVFVSFILGFLIVYASRFLIKRRNKEFGVYLTLGMSKKKISFILLIETLMIGIVSLVIGLGIGILLSQLMSVFVANMFEADIEEFQFVFSQSAAIKSCLYFSIMYLIVMVFNTFSISKCKLIDLLHGKKKSEKIKIKNPLVCILVFLISSSLLGYAYYLVTGGLVKLQNANEIYIPIAIGCFTTFLIFWSLSGLILRIVMSFKNIYYRGLNSFTLRQISSKVNTTVFQMTIICLMLFVTICVLSGALSIKNSMTANLNTLAPADIQLLQPMNIKEDRAAKYTTSQISHSNLTSLEVLNALGISLEHDLKDIVSINYYSTPALTFRDTFGTTLEQVQKQFRFLSFDTQENIIKLSDYNKLATLFERETYTLNSNEYMIIGDFDSMTSLRNIALANGEKISIFGVTLFPKYSECKDGIIEMSSGHINSGVFIVPDEIVDENFLVANLLTANYKANTKEEKVKIEKQLLDIEESNVYILPEGTTRLTIAEASLGLGGLVTFIGLYLGIIFLISSAAILALKELSESSDNKERFRILRKIGADERNINRALFSQIGIFFLFPLLLAIIHSIFGIQFCNSILETFGNDKLLPSIVMTALFIILIYGGYFLLTYYCSKNIIKERV